MSEKKNFASVLRVWLLAGLVGVLASACSLLGFSAWMASHHCSGSAAVPLAAAAVGLGSFCSGWVTAFCKRERGLFCGIAQGLWFAALLFVLALLLFLTGVVFCYFAVYSLAVDFFLVAGDSLATPMLSIDKYVSFLFGFLVPFGVAFQLPVVLYLTTRVGLTTPDMLRSKRKYVILAIFVLAAILTPPDVVSQVALGLPMCGLYEIGILVSRCTKARERA